MADTARIPVLSLWRPWPNLILQHGKDIENRSWATHYRGPLWIHAAKRWDADGWFVARARDIKIPDESRDPTGIVGLVELVDLCSTLATAPHEWICDCSDWAAVGQYHWRLADRRPIGPIPCSGRQGLWWPTGELAEQLQEAISHG